MQFDGSVRVQPRGDGIQLQLVRGELLQLPDLQVLPRHDDLQREREL